MKTNGFKYLVAAIIPIATLASPVYAQQNADTTRALNTKALPTEGDNEQSKPNAYQLFGYGDPKLDSLNRQIIHYSNVIYHYDHNHAYEILNANAKGFSKPTPAFYNNDTLRRLMGRLDKISEYFKTHLSRDLNLKRDSLGRLIGDYFKTEKFAAVNAKLQIQYHIDPAKKYTDADAGYRQYREELFRKMPAEVKKDIRELKELSAEVRNQLQSPQNIAYLKQIPILIDSMKSYYKQPHAEQYTYASYEATMDVPIEQRHKAQDELQAHFKNPDFRHASELLNTYGQQMRDYYKRTPAVKEREEAWKNQLRTILADDYDSIVHPGHYLSY